MRRLGCGERFSMSTGRRSAHVCVLRHVGHHTTIYTVHAPRHSCKECTSKSMHAYQTISARIIAQARGAKGLHTTQQAAQSLNFKPNTIAEVDTEICAGLRNHLDCSPVHHTFATPIPNARNPLKITNILCGQTLHSIRRVIRRSLSLRA